MEDTFHHLKIHFGAGEIAQCLHTLPSLQPSQVQFLVSHKVPQVWQKYFWVLSHESPPDRHQGGQPPPQIINKAYIFLELEG